MKMNTTKLRPVSTTPPSIEVTAFSSIADCVKIAQGAQLTVADEVLLTVEKSSLRLDSCIASGQPIYGINTGFGPLAKYKVTRPDYEQNQKNLIYLLKVNMRLS